MILSLGHLGYAILLRDHRQVKVAPWQILPLRCEAYDFKISSFVSCKTTFIALRLLHKCSSRLLYVREDEYRHELHNTDENRIVGIYPIQDYFYYRMIMVLWMEFTISELERYLNCAGGEMFSKNDCECRVINHIPHRVPIHALSICQTSWRCEQGILL